MRGSTPCACESLRRYGGNTACVVLEEPGHRPIILDLGTGLRFYGLDRGTDEPFRGTALVTHLHWDHIQGIPFFAPLLSEGSRLDLYAPAQEGERLADVVRGFLSPPYFPVDVAALPGEIDFHDTVPGEFELDGAHVRAAWVPHVGPTLGYRVEMGGRSVAYLSDHQQPGVGSTEVDPGVVELCAGADVLIHDAQFDDAEFAERSDWGHCTVDYAVEVAARAGVRTLVLFHHDPSHTDARVDDLLEGARRRAAEMGVGEVIAASEGLTISLSPVDAPADAPADASAEPTAEPTVAAPVDDATALPADDPAAAHVAAAR